MTVLNLKKKLMKWFINSIELKGNIFFSKKSKTDGDSKGKVMCSANKQKSLWTFNNCFSSDTTKNVKPSMSKVVTNY